MATKHRSLAVMWALVVVAVILFGIPAALGWASGNPLSSDTWRKITDGWGNGLAPEITPTAVVQILAAVCWLAWMLLATAVIGELYAAARGGRARPIRGLTFFQGFASMLVTPLALALASLPAAAKSATPLIPAPTASAPVAAPISTAAVATRSDQPRPGHYRVRLGDTLDRVAEEQLGDALRWRDLWALNRDRTMNDGRAFSKPTTLREGWDLLMPAASNGHPTSASVSEPAGAPDVVLTPSAPTWVVERGQSLRRIAHLAYGVTDAQSGMRVVRAVLDVNGLADASALAAGSTLTLPSVPPIADAPLAPPVSSSVTVEPGDTLAGIAQRVYGEAAQWPVIWEANQGRDVGAGAVLVDPDQIDVGWQLLIPERTAPATPPAAATHLVVPGDTLWDISASHYDREDPALVDLVFETNRGVADAEGHVLHDPDLIHPGMRLELPGDPLTPTPGPAPTANPAATPTPTPAATASASSAPAVPAPPAPPPTELAPVEDSPPETASTPHPAPPAAEADPPPAPPPATLTPVATTPGSGDPITAPAPSRTPSARLSGSVDVDVESQSTSSRQLALATLLATGALTVIDARRRRRLQQMGAHDVLPLPDPDLVPTDAALRSGADAAGIARLDLALRSLAAHLTAGSGTRARPELVIRHGTGRIEVHVDAVGADPPEPWKTDGGRVWSLAPNVATADLAGAARGVAPPCPALVMLGRAGMSEVYLDLEAVGILRLDAPPDQVACLARALVAGLAVSPLADVVRVVAAGFDVYGFANESRIELVSGATEAVRAARASSAPVRAMLDDEGRLTTFALRAQGGQEPWEPTMVLLVQTALDGEHAADLATLVGDGGRGVALVTDHPLATGRWQLSITDRRRWRLEPVGLTLDPVRLAAEELADLGALLQDARTEAAAALPVRKPSPVAPAAIPFVEPPWELQVRLLGPVEVVNRNGKVGIVEKSKSLELLAWLTQHRAGSTRTAARTAMWETDVRDVTFANIVSDARRTLARLADPPDDADWIARTNSERLPLHRLVITDVDLVKARLEHARGQRDEVAVETLRDALEMVRDVPYAGSNYLWPDGEGLASNLTLLVTATASEMAVRALRLGDVEAVFWATSQGLKVLPGHDELVCLRMQAHGLTGDLANVRHEYEAYERVILNDPWGDATPSAKVVECRSRLLHGEVTAGPWAT